MAIEGLTQQQSDFIERFFKVPRVFGNTAKNQQREEAKEQFRVFNAEQDVLREEIAAIPDDAKRAELFSQLRQAGAGIEANPDALDFDGGQAQLDNVREAAMVEVKGGEARDTFEAFETRMQALNGGKGLEAPKGAADAQSDIAQTWAFVQDKLSAGQEGGDLKAIESAIKAMDRLEVMLDDATHTEVNPFDTGLAAGASAAARSQLDGDAMGARHKLREVFTQHSALKEALGATFGTDSVPLELGFGMTATLAKLTEAETAADGDLVDLADDAETNFAQVNKKASKLIAEAEAWKLDEAAFLLRYQVMLTHRLKTTPRVKSAFEDITKAYTACKGLAKEHNYTQACMDITALRNNLKDALDLADDYASYTLVYGARKALLATLPPRDSYVLPEMAAQYDETQKLLVDADAARVAKQMTGALTILNTIPKAVEELLELNKFAKSYLQAKTDQNAALSGINSNFTSDVLSLLKSDLELSKKVVLAAQSAAQAGDYRTASSQMYEQATFCFGLRRKADYINGYFADSEAFAKRLAQTIARKGPEGGVAIEAYHQALIGNEAKRAAAEAVGNFKLAKAMCLRLADQHRDMMDLADDAKEYLAEEMVFKAALAKLKTATSADALDAKANAQDMKAYAIAATERGNWNAATNLLENANLEIKRAVDDVETAKLIDGMQGGSDKMALSTDATFKDVYAAFANILSHTRALDTQKLFSQEFAEADAKAKSIEADMAQDPVGAEVTLNEAIAECRALALKCSAADGYRAQDAAAKALIARADGMNGEHVIDEELRQAQEAYARAKSMAESSTPDFVGAIGALSDAQAAARTGLDAMASYGVAIKDARDKMDLALASYNDPDYAPYLGKQAAQVQTVLDQMNADFDARKLASSETLAAKGVALAAHHTELCAACDDVYQYLPFLEPGTEGPEATHPLTQNVEQVKKVELVAQMHVALGDGQFKRADMLLREAYALMMAARAKVVAFDAYLAAEIASEEKLRALEIRSVPEAGPAHDAVLTLRKTFEDVLAQKALENYTGAQKRLDGFDAAAQTASAQLDTYDRYVLRQTQARKALEGVQQMKAPAIETLVTRLEGKERNADRKGQSFDFVNGTALYQELATDCANAKGTADAVENILIMTDEISAIGDKDVDALKIAVGKLRLGFEGMRGQQSSVYLMADIGTAQEALEAADALAEEDFDAGRAAVQDSVDTSKQLTLALAQYDQLTEAAAVAHALAKTLLGRNPEVDLLRTEIEGEMLTLKVAMKAARQSPDNRPQTQQAVETTIARLRDLRAVLDAQAKYLADLAPLKTALVDLEKSKFRSVVLDDITQTRKHLDAAAGHVFAKAHKEADAELKQAANRIDLAKLRAKLATNKAPNLEEVEAILWSPGGSANLDEIVENLEPSVQRKVLAVAFQARFGCELQLVTRIPQEGEAPDHADMDEPAVDMKRFYAEMSKLPNSDTLDNDSMLTFTSSTEDPSYSEYDGQKKQVVMREGNEAASEIYPVAIEHEIGEIDPNALPKQGEARTSFSWNTLHEVGHAVDDKLGYMKKNGQRLAGWTAYEGNVTEAAVAIAEHFEFDADYIAEYMMSTAGRKMPVPEPVNCDAEEWNSRLSACRIFIDRARTSNKPWESASIAAACAIGNFTYVESYEGSWARYRTDQRKYAVSGYQFRAPGEWFSELYAAISSDRLNDNHPHHDEFAKICQKENA